MAEETTTQVLRETANLKKLLYKTIENKKTSTGALTFGKDGSNITVIKLCEIARDNSSTISSKCGRFHVKITVDFYGHSGSYYANGSVLISACSLNRDIGTNTNSSICINTLYRSTNNIFGSVYAFIDDEDNKSYIYMGFENTVNIDELITHTEIISGNPTFNTLNNVESDKINITSYEADINMDSTVFFDDNYDIGTVIPYNHVVKYRNIYATNTIGIGGTQDEFSTGRAGYLNMYGPDGSSKVYLRSYDNYGCCDLRNSSGTNTITLNGNNGNIECKSIKVNGSNNGIIAECDNTYQGNSISIMDSDGVNTRVVLGSKYYNVTDSNDENENYGGLIWLKDNSNNETLTLRSDNNGQIRLGSNTNRLSGSAIVLTGSDGTISCTTLTGTTEISAPTIKAGSGIALTANGGTISCITLTGTTLTGTTEISAPTIKAGTTITLNDGIITATTIKATSFTATSDRRLKTNIEDFIPSKSILDLPIKSFDYITTNKHAIGCIAQDLQEICPEIVDTDSSGYLSIQESKIVYLLLDELKKVRKEFDEYKEKTTERYDILLSRIEKLEKGE